MLRYCLMGISHVRWYIMLAFRMSDRHFALSVLRPKVACFLSSLGSCCCLFFSSLGSSRK